jgi:hypothetical protein
MPLGSPVGKVEQTFTMANGARQRYRGGERMNVERSRITLLMGGAAFALALTTGTWSLARSQPLPGVTVYKSPT